MQNEESGLNITGFVVQTGRDKVQELASVDHVKDVLALTPLNLPVSPSVFYANVSIDNEPAIQLSLNGLTSGKPLYFGGRSNEFTLLYDTEKWVFTAQSVADPEVFSVWEAANGTEDVPDGLTFTPVSPETREIAVTNSTLGGLFGQQCIVNGTDIYECTQESPVRWTKMAKSADVDLTSGPVTSDAGVSSIANGAITNAMLEGSFVSLSGAEVVSGQKTFIEPVITVSASKKIRTVAFFGDSRVAHSGTEFSHYCNGPLMHFMAAIQNRLLLTPNTYDTENVNCPTFSKVGGHFQGFNDDAGSYPRTKQCVDSAPDLVVIYAGVNNINSESNRSELPITVSRLRSAGIRVVMSLEPYYPSTNVNGTTLNEQIELWNEYVVGYCQAHGVPYYDARSDFNQSSNGYAKPWAFSDGSVHYNYIGAAFVGRGLARVVLSEFAGVLPEPYIRDTFIRNTAMKDKWFASGVYDSDGYDGWRITKNGTTTFSATAAARTDGQRGNWMDIVITGTNEGDPTAYGSRGEVNVQQSLITNLPPAGWYYGVCEINVIEWLEAAPAGETSLKFPQFSIFATGGVGRVESTIGANETFLAVEVGHRSGPNLGGKIMLRTPPIHLTNQTQLSLLLVLRGNCHVQIGNMAAIPYP